MIEQYHQHFFSSPSHFFAAPVARLLRFYNIPLLTAGGLALDYTNDKRDPGEELLQSVLECEFSESNFLVFLESEFHLLVKTGYSYTHMVQFISKVFQQ